MYESRTSTIHCACNSNHAVVSFFMFYFLDYKLKYFFFARCQWEHLTFAVKHCITAQTILIYAYRRRSNWIARKWWQREERENKKEEHEPNNLTSWNRVNCNQVNPNEYIVIVELGKYVLLDAWLCLAIRTEICRSKWRYPWKCIVRLNLSRFQGSIHLNKELKTNIFIDQIGFTWLLISSPGTSKCEEANKKFSTFSIS